MRFLPTGPARAALSLLAILIATFAASCGGSPSTQTTSGLTFRAFVSNPLFPLSTGGGTPTLQIVNASTDVLSAFRVTLATTIPTAGMMALTPDRRFTLVLSPSTAQIATIDNSIEAPAADGAGNILPAIQLPGTTDSFIASPNGFVAYAAVPNAIITGQPLGALVAINYDTSSVTATVPVASAHYVTQSHDGNTLLVFSDNSNAVTVISPSLIGTGTDPRTTVCCFDHPVWGVFSADDTVAYIFSCGPECGGTTASITVLNLLDDSLGTVIPVDGATTGLLNGSTLYVAGTPPSNGANTCAGSNTSATSCGRFDTVDVTSLTKTGSAIITDGYHNLIQLGSNGQVFVGAIACTSLATSSETRGCLSIVNTNGTLSATVPPISGNVTGIEPITTRTVVYVCQNNELWIYDTTTDTLQSTQINIVGQAVDVKLVDGPP